MLLLILKKKILGGGNHRATPPNCLTTPQGVATPTLGTTALDHNGIANSNRSGGERFLGQICSR